MRLDGRRESSNVDDRRHMSTGKKIGGGIGGVVIIALITLLQGGGLGDIINNVGGEMMQQGTEVTQNTGEFSAEEEALATFAKQIFAGTEDVWADEFSKRGMTYQPCRLVLFSDAVSSGCGNATSECGPFYCSADQTVYIDLDFFLTMKQQIGADGDFAYAYVIAHEVGHHVQYLLGTLGEVHQLRSRLSDAEYNKMSVRLELQADYFAGVWAKRDNEMFGSLEEGDIEEGLAVAAKIGDDYLQKKARGYAQPETFNHGTSAQRAKWLKLGVANGTIEGGDTFSPNYNAL